MSNLTNLIKNYKTKTKTKFTDEEAVEKYYSIREHLQKNFTTVENDMEILAAKSCIDAIKSGKVEYNKTDQTIKFVLGTKIKLGQNDAETHFLVFKKKSPKLLSDAGVDILMLSQDINTKNYDKLICAMCECSERLSGLLDTQDFMHCIAIAQLFLG